MKKVYPNIPLEVTGEPIVLTVWRKSLLFNCSGFTVFDSKGDLLFRVDNYAAGSRAEAVLMDADGKPLYTVRRKRLSLGNHWLIFDGEETKRPRLSVKKQINNLFFMGRPSSKRIARIAPCAGRKSDGFHLEGSYRGRSCAVYGDARRQRMAEITKKEAAGGVGLGNDVFRLVVEPGLEMSLTMAIVLVFEQMFGSSRGSH